MLMPKKTKFRKFQKGRNRGKSFRGNRLAFGTMGIKAIEAGQIDSRQIESARVAINRTVSRQGKVWIRVFPDKALSAKPLEVRMGKGKGAIDRWVMNIKPGRVCFEITGVDEALAKKALTNAIHKLPFKAKIITAESENEVY